MAVSSIWEAEGSILNSADSLIGVFPTGYMKCYHTLVPPPRVSISPIVLEEISF